MENNNNAQDCLNWLIDEILGEGWYVEENLSQERINKIATLEILRKVKKKDWRMRRFCSTFDFFNEINN